MNKRVKRNKPFKTFERAMEYSKENNQEGNNRPIIVFDDWKSALPALKIIYGKNKD